MMIKAKAICIFKQQDKILLSKSHDPTQQECFLRPIGGSIEFGETSIEAVKREVLEEIKAEITNIKLLKVYENLFCFDAKQGHEIVFVYQADFIDPLFYQQDRIEAYESDGSPLEVRWFKQTELNNYPIYPNGISALFVER